MSKKNQRRSKSLKEVQDEIFAKTTGPSITPEDYVKAFPLPSILKDPSFPSKR